MTTAQDWVEAYYNCRKGKRDTVNAVEYEMEFEKLLMALMKSVNDRTYVPGPSICFVVRRPRYREVFAAAFGDRIVHHYAALRLEPLFEQIFNERTFNCRKGKGQLLGVKMLQGDIYECSEGYTGDCWVLKLDLKGFFMSINKRMLADMVDRFIVEHYIGEDKEDLRYICNILIMHEPEKNCVRKSPMEYWEYLPANKSLFTNGEGLGVAIGNLFAQLFANFLLNLIDWMLESVEGLYHGRYVDDIYGVAAKKETLLAVVPIIREELAKLGLKLNEKKFYLQHYTKGIRFTGAVVKPGRTYAANETARSFRKAVLRLNKAAAGNDVEKVRKFVASVNSYLGLLGHYNEYGMRRETLNLLEHDAYKYLYITGKFKKVTLKKKYRKGYDIEEKIRQGDWDGALCA